MDIQSIQINPLESTFMEPVVMDIPDRTAEICKHDEMINPFFISPMGTNIVNISAKLLEKDGVVLCRKNNTEKDLNVLSSRIIKRHTFNNLAERYTLLPCNKQIYRSKTHIKQSKLVLSDKLNFLNDKNLDLEDNELVLCLPDITEDMFRKYSSIYNHKISLNDLRDLVVMYDYFDCSEYHLARSGLANTITRLKEASFYTYPWNCSMVNYSTNFMNKRFQSHTIPYNKIQASSSKDVPNSKTRNELLKLSKVSIEGIDSLSYIYKYNDEQNSIETSLYKYDAKIHDVVFSGDDMFRWFHNMKDDRMKFNLFTTLLLSKDYCHLLINNVEILKTMSSMIHKSIAFIKYIFSYTWTYMYLDECATRDTVTNDSRYVFDINTAHHLPSFPFNINNLKTSPYCTVMVDQNILNTKYNFLSLPCLFDNERQINTFDDFKKNLNLLTTHKSIDNIFNGLSWYKDSVQQFGLTGSTVSLCAMKNNPLAKLVCDDAENENNKFLTLARHYYNDADYNIICHSDNVFNYMDKVLEVVDVVTKNVNTYHESSTEQTLDVDTSTNLTVIITPEYVKHFMNDYLVDNTGSFDEKYVANNMNNDIVKDHFYAIYLKNKMEQNSKQRTLNRKKKFKNELYSKYYKFTNCNDIQLELLKENIDYEKVYNIDSDKIFRYNDIAEEASLDMVEEEFNKIVLVISERIEFSLSHKFLDKRKIKINRIDQPNYMSHVSTTGVSFNKCLYDGNSVKMLPSCVTSLLTGVCMDFDMYSDIKDPYDKLNKYRSRGFSVLLNNFQKMQLIDYNRNIDNYKGMYSLKSKGQIDVLESLGYKKLDNDIFKPLKYMENLPNSVFNSPTVTYIKSDKDMFDVYSKIYKYNYQDSGINFLAFNAINKDGNIQPVKLFLLEAAYDELF
jgi:hypothetical protein